MKLIYPPLVVSVMRLIEKYNLTQVVRYLMVGVCAAGTHYATALVAHHLLNIPPTISNFLGFVAGAFVSYLGSYYFTFNSSDAHSNVIPRFILVWLIGIAINVGLFKFLLTQFNVPFALNVFIAIVLTPIASYLMLKFYAFRKPD